VVHDATSSLLAFAKKCPAADFDQPRWMPVRRWKVDARLEFRSPAARYHPLGIELVHYTGPAGGGHLIRGAGKALRPVHGEAFRDRPGLSEALVGSVLPLSSFSRAE
jgi:hypothetical protein